MSVKVLVVDDSSFFRRRVTEILNQDKDLEVIDTAVNGKDAIEKALKLKPDVITMDVEMPVMDGITSVKGIMKSNPIPILMFSSLTHEGAKSTFEALDAGAVDFLPKKFEDIARDKEEAVLLLQQRVKAIAKKRVRPSSSSRTTSFSRTTNDKASALSRSSSTSSSLSTTQAQSAPRAQPKPVQPIVTRKGANSTAYKLLAIGTSTGGPVALQKVLTQFPANYPHPIIIIQHMPAAFTPAFASRLNTLCKINVKQAEDGELLQTGVAYLAPGGKQMLIEGSGQGKIRIIEDNSPRITYKPSVDISFGSAAKVFKDKVLAVVLTGMGADGREGARLLKQFGSKIFAQDEASCVVYGMPQAVASAGLSEADISINDMASRILKEVGYG